MDREFVCEVVVFVGKGGAWTCGDLPCAASSWTHVTNQLPSVDVDRAHRMTRGVLEVIGAKCPLCQAEELPGFSTTNTLRNRLLPRTSTSSLRERSRQASTADTTST